MEISKKIGYFIKSIGWVINLIKLILEQAKYFYWKNKNILINRFKIDNESKL